MKAFKSFKLFTSIDTWGPAAEYARTGLDLALWEANLKRVLQLTKAPVILMVTYNVLSVTSFKSLLEKILEWRRVFYYRLSFDVQYLTEPLQYSILLLPKQEFLPYMHQALAFMKDNTNDNNRTKFSTAEYKKFEQIVTYMETTNMPDHKLIEGRRDFSAWFTEHDVRRNTNFATTFPDMVNIFNEWKKL